MSEQAQRVDQGHQEWLNSRSPDLKKSRVEDIEKARVMADAADFYETNAATLRYAGNKALNEISEPEEFGRSVVTMIHRNDLPERYKGRDMGIPFEDIEDIEDLTTEIKTNQQEADEHAEFAGHVHDALKNTKR